MQKQYVQLHQYLDTYAKYLGKYGYDLDPSDQNEDLSHLRDYQGKMPWASEGEGVPEFEREGVWASIQFQASVFLSLLFE